MSKKEKVTRKEQTNDSFPPYPPYFYPPCEEDELDLYEVWMTLCKRKKWILYSLAFFIALGIFYLILAKPKYRATAVYEVGGINLPTMAVTQAVENLNIALKNKNYKLVANSLGVSYTSAKQIISFDIQTEKGKAVHSLKISTAVSNKTLIPLLGIKFEEYLNTIPAVKNAIEQKKLYLETKILTDEEQIRELERLKEELLKRFSTAKDIQVKNLLLAQITGINNQILNKKADINFAKLQLKQLKGIQLAVPPVVPDKPYSPKKVLILIISAVSGLFLGIFLALFVDWLEKVKKSHEGKL